MTSIELVPPADRHSSTDIALDPSGLGPQPPTPLVPEEILRKHHVFVPTDGRFRAAARLLQSLWRQDRDLSAGSFVDLSGGRHKLGSSISKQAGRDGHNFLSPAIAQVVHRELVYREIGAMFDTDRLRTNLLSSMPLCFNAFALMKRDLDLARRVMHELLPGAFQHVDHVRFEHSPGRGRASYTNDHTAFDVALYGQTPQGLRGLVCFEVKYSESMQETAPHQLSKRLYEIARDAELYADFDSAALYRNPLQQLTREHLLAQSMLDQGLVDVAIFVLLAPERNHLVQTAAQTYASYLRGPRQGRAHFASISLERLIESYAAARQESFARLLHRRYADFWLLDGELNLDDPPDPVASAAQAVDLPVAA